ncbi:inactive receptor-like protein kinase [Actinidia chinensis var. chinensis]|uniref:Inactive receptor-like protein kinase n=1 Tax=Actinidia chinensis var. chinensis TaxID=1590841 RepID=A0A2R6QB34_ACTCC|nr:inactive receptor-like protein kinase [Actinidia chinensis var. chinensis]
MAICLLFISFVILRLNQLAVVSHSLQQQQQQPSNECSDQCGSFQIPFPFYLNTSCGSKTPISDAFRLSCQNSTSLFLNIASQTYPILQFFPDGVLVGFPNTTTTTTSSSSTCGGVRHPYNDLNAFGFEGNDYFGISTDNVVGLYDCEDSSLCKEDCMFMPAPGCDIHGYPACCYPLSDGSSWRIGDGFSVFYQFGCRGFSCWVGNGNGNGNGSNNNNNNNSTGKRGVKLEWAVPKNSSKAQCAPNAYSVHATSLTSGVRCQCLHGFVGDGFALGLGCHKSCLKDGREVYGKDCFMKGHNRRKLEILAGVLASAVSVASLTALFCLLKRPSKSTTLDPDQDHIQGAISYQKACKTRYFSYHELEEATKGFDDGQKVADSAKGTLYAGVIGDGSSVAVHKVHYVSERDLIQVLSFVETLSAVPHQNLARILGCCTDTGCTPLVVYESPANGTLEEHLHRNRGEKMGIDWCKRLNIASEIAGVLAFLQYEISPPILHHDLQSGCIFLDEDFSVKIAGFVLLSANLGCQAIGPPYNSFAKN